MLPSAEWLLVPSLTVSVVLISQCPCCCNAGLVVSMLYNADMAELITAGSQGSKLWGCQLDLESYEKRAQQNLHYRGRLKTDLANPWELGQFQFVRERATLR